MSITAQGNELASVCLNSEVCVMSADSHVSVGLGHMGIPVITPGLNIHIKTTTAFFSLFPQYPVVPEKNILFF